jgi:hypothetical protein
MNTPLISRPSVSLVVCGLLFAPVLSPAGILDFLLPNYDLEAITVTDVTEAGAHRRIPTPANPVYFVAVSAGYIKLGGAKAGEKPISRQFVTTGMLKALAKQGYLPASVEHNPEIAIVWTWGTLNAQRSPFLPSADTPLNHGQIVRFLGGEKLGYASRRAVAFREFEPRTGLVPGGHLQVLLDVAKDDLYIAVIAAFDLGPTFSEKPVMLWQTRVSCPARGFWLPEVMPAMLAIASPYLGQETAKPVWVRATDKFRPDIQLGDTKLVEYIEQGKAPVVEIGASR